VYLLKLLIIQTKCKVKPQGGSIPKIKDQGQGACFMFNKKLSSLKKVQAKFMMIVYISGTRETMQHLHHNISLHMYYLWHSPMVYKKTFNLNHIGRD
jgi:hypothetical protein